MNSTAVMPRTGAFGAICLAWSRHSEILYIVIFTINLLIKPHPSTHLSLDKLGHKTNFQVVAGKVSDLIKSVDFAISGTFSMATVEIYCLGIPVASLIESSGLDFSLLAGKPSAFVVSSAEELVELMDNFDALPKPDAAFEIFDLDPDLKRCSELVEQPFDLGGRLTETTRG